ncbi:formin-like protein 8 [Sebastes umbrosus]|uniref:formin-like protein 8 n=1 Tax=Sebastes umbrosus TaxID=72105 RepID=UPI00189D2763|nr:formin-like protein 8 [Sebastes umbrosus]
MFHIIEFLESKTVAVVPENWCTYGVTNYKNDERVNRAVRKAEEPGPDWQSYDVRVVKSCDHYFEARHLLKKSLTCNTSDLQSEEEEEEVQSKRRPKPIHFFGDSDDDSEEESPQKKRARGPAKPSPQPPAPIIPPLPRCVPSSVTVALPPPVAPPSPTPPAVEQTPSSSQVYRPTWRGGRCGSDTITCSGEQYLKRL